MLRCSSSGQTTLCYLRRGECHSTLERLPSFGQRDVLLRSYRYFHQVVPPIDNLTPDQAILYLKERASNVPNNVTFLGVSVPRSMILITAGAMLGLLFVFSRSLAHLDLSFPSSPENLQTLRNFSWIALFDERWSRYFNYLSIVWLPTASVAFLGLSSLYGLGTSPSLIGLALVLVVVGMSLSLSQGAIRTVEVLRSRIERAKSSSVAIHYDWRQDP